MRPLRIIVATADAERLRAALIVVSAHAALGGAAALFLQLDAVGLLRRPIVAPQDNAHRAAGLPDLAAVLAEAQALGVMISACQSGLALCGMTAEALPPDVEVGGPVTFLQATDDDARLLLA